MYLKPPGEILEPTRRVRDEVPTRRGRDEVGINGMNLRVKHTESSDSFAWVSIRLITRSVRIFRGTHTCSRSHVVVCLSSPSNTTAGKPLAALTFQAGQQS